MNGAGQHSNQLVKTRGNLTLCSPSFLWPMHTLEWTSNSPLFAESACRSLYRPIVDNKEKFATPQVPSKWTIEW